MAKGFMAVLLVLIGSFASSKERGPDAEGPPYYIGAFITGALSFLTCLSSFAVANTTKDTRSQSSLRKLAGHITCESRLTYLTMISCVIGIILVSMFGFKGCKSACNYSKYSSRYLPLHLLMAKLILACLIIVILLGIFTSYLNCCSSLVADVRKTILNRSESEDSIDRVPFQMEHFTPVIPRAPIADTQSFDNLRAPPTTSSQLDDTVIRLQEENRRLREQLGRPNFEDHMAPPPSYSDVISQEYEKNNDSGTKPGIPPVFGENCKAEQENDESMKPSAPPCECMK